MYVLSQRCGGGGGWAGGGGVATADRQLEIVTYAPLWDGKSAADQEKSPAATRKTLALPQL